MLEPITGERLNNGAITTDNARDKISVGSFWVLGQRVFFDVKIVNAFVLRYMTQNLAYGGRHDRKVVLILIRFIHFLGLFFDIF